MRILGIDPGLTRCGIGVVCAHGPRSIEFEHVEVLTTAAEDPLQKRIATIGDAVGRLLDGDDPPAAIALERVFAQQNLPSVMGVAQVSGVVLYLAAQRNIPVQMYTPNEVKLQVTGYGSAEKTQVANMVTRLLGLKTVPKPADAADALALAVAHAWNVTRAQAPSRGSDLSQASVNGRVAGAGRAVGGETPAQRAWREAEQKVGSRRGVQRR